MPEVLHIRNNPEHFACCGSFRTLLSINRCLAVYDRDRGRNAVTPLCYRFYFSEASPWIQAENEQYRRAIDFPL